MARWLAAVMFVASATVRATRVFELDDLLTDLTPAAGFANMLTLNYSLSAGNDIRVVIACPPAGNLTCNIPLVGGAQATGQTGVELVLGAGVTLVAQHSFSIEDHADDYWAYNDGDDDDFQVGRMKRIRIAHVGCWWVVWWVGSSRARVSDCGRRRRKRTPR